ncbi:type VII secretion system-associated protein [Streptomyces sp. NPDC056492]|uniref:type VII secretion system-associated protein n=1 Tax=unclassified Streptomyces TaxID=2593676 RepID=UPI003695975B
MASAHEESETVGPSGPAPGADPVPGLGVSPGEPGYRTPPDDIVAAAKTAPGHWLHMVDPNWMGSDGEEPPSWAVLGRWRTDEEGEIVEWQTNDAYRPSPDVQDWAPPAGRLDHALQLTATGYMDESVLHLVLADSELAVCVEEDGTLTTVELPEGPKAVPVFPPSPALSADDVPPHTLMPALELLDRLVDDDRQVLVLSSSAPVAQIVPPEALRAAYADVERWRAEHPEEAVAAT